MAKPEWGTKRTCPKCGTRFYDLGKDDPVVCIDCGAEWVPEPLLKSKQPVPAEAPKKVSAKKEDEDAEALVDNEEEDLEIEDDEDVDVDVDLDDGDDEDVTGVVGASKPDKDD